jgi:hypothetical protein
MLFIATDSAVSRAKCNPGKSKGWWARSARHYFSAKLKFEFQTAKQDKRPRSRGAIAPELCMNHPPKKKTEGAGKAG